MSSTDAKTCVVCGIDCASVPRYKDAEGRYYCQPCGDRVAEEKAQAAAAPAPRVGLSVRKSPDPPPSAGPAAAELLPPQRYAPRKRQEALLKTPVGIAVGVAGWFAVLLVLARVVPAVGLLYILSCVVLGVGIGIGTLVSAFRTSILQGLLTFFVPFYFLYYIFGVSKNRVLMVLAPLTPIVLLGMILLPGTKFEADSGLHEATAAGIEAGSPGGGQNRSEREMAGYMN